MTIAVYPGSFDPFTNGHLDIVRRVDKLFDTVIVVVLNNPDKEPLFPVSERINLISNCLGDLPNIEVDSFGGLLVDYVRSRNAEVIVRGLRTESDFESEFPMAQMNRKLYGKAVTLFVPADAGTSFVSSSLVKQIAANHGSVVPFVPLVVAKALERRYLPPQI